MENNRGVHVVATVPEPSITYEYAELKRKLERREVDLKRREKEITSYQKEISRIHKEVKLANAEMQSLRDRNEMLQQSLINSRLASQNNRDDADAKLASNRIRDLEAALQTSHHKHNLCEEELTSTKKTVAALQFQVEALHSQADASKNSEMKALQELEDYKVKFKQREEFVAKREAFIAENEKLVAQTENRIIALNSELEKKDGYILKCEGQIRDLKDDVKKLKSTLEVRSETNAVLRTQLEEINGSRFTLTREQMDKFQGLEQENRQLTTRIKDLVKSVELHMDLLQRAEEESSAAKQSALDLKTLHENTKNEMFVLERKNVDNTQLLRELKREVVKLRKENKSLLQEMKEHRNQPVVTAELVSAKQGLQALKETSQKEMDARQEEKRKRINAEEAAKALRGRISFLLEQLEVASKISVAWREQKGVLKAEIATLHATNLELRQRLASLQQSFVGRHIRDVADPAGANAFLTPSYLPAHGMAVSSPSPAANKKTLPLLPPHTTQPELSATEEIISGRNGVEWNALGGAFKDPAANTLPTTPSSLIERALFDAVCAFTSGTRALRGKNSFGKKKRPLKNTFKVQIDHDGNYDIVLRKENGDNETSSSSSSSSDAEALELLNSMQISAFLRFCQTRPDSKLMSLFSEKIASILNYIRHSMADLVDQLGESRIETAKGFSKEAISVERFDKLRARYCKERLSKQQIVMKYVREQMKHSDMCIALEDMARASRDTLEELSQTDKFKEAQIALVGYAKPAMELMVQFSSIVDELAVAGASSGTTTGPVGALEIRLANSQVDDETLNSLMGLICGVLVDGTWTNGSSGNDERGGVRIEGGTKMIRMMLMLMVTIPINLYLCPCQDRNFNKDHPCCPRQFPWQ